MTFRVFMILNVIGSVLSHHGIRICKPNEQFPHEFTCSRYYICRNGIRVPVVCSIGKYYHPQLRSCGPLVDVATLCPFDVLKEIERLRAQSQLSTTTSTSTTTTITPRTTTSTTPQTTTIASDEDNSTANLIKLGKRKQKKPKPKPKSVKSEQKSTKKSKKTKGKPSKKTKSKNTKSKQNKKSKTKGKKKKTKSKKKKSKKGWNSSNSLIKRTTERPWPKPWEKFMPTTKRGRRYKPITVPTPKKRNRQRFRGLKTNFNRDYEEINSQRVKVPKLNRDNEEINSDWEHDQIDNELYFESRDK